MATTKLPVPALADASNHAPKVGLVDYLTTVDHKKMALLTLPWVV
jgi:hypothetical protein